MNFKRLSIVAVFILVFLMLVGSALAAAAVRITIQDREVDLRSPSAQVNLSLPGNPSYPQTFHIPITITYDDGSTRNVGFVFNYRPKQTCPYQEDPQNCPYGGTRNCTGTDEGQGCHYNSEVDPACSETCNSAPVPRGCYDSQDFSEYVRCGGCGEEIWACYDEDGKHERRFYGGDTAGYCTGPDQCGQSQPPQSCEERHIRNECISCNTSQKVYQRFCGGQEAGDPYAGGSQGDGACGDWCSQSQPPPEPEPEPQNQPSCDEDVYYCDENQHYYIHKHGGYQDGNTCQYAFDVLYDEPC
ncbi:hypothetical protein A3H81_00985 [Candidatus Daviesbacteria bacterium RIFCSPLOWO2_02_FULL_38_18]|nr:MAG: hypothetical protein A3D02_00180 [Candidatus Daviesbacteria bacterium RIFCSPHIGHO2_02_FULL_39_41]OGE29778.1 MAG: hypothetical protein A2772_00560 [Candidatus Daviesbacteria bacterium RIFCSPHIGHO2_01_FULL_38_8b]OGE45480.1 MAG: hypothetical protein A3E67_03840 [Candidatus Daviesbacteria bacterium RIFCSPHIGHO2_12_FULL_38_25]OGE67566.1 MAG: hypothetical protein A3H81_00985 [Candidatus Daviesbacteria bacterium RIFCSPLOWO2_02_FULL_38_18]OGE72786.1 MAG: hypothetical protein A3H18_03955 [Candid